MMRTVMQNVKMASFIVALLAWHAFAFAGKTPAPYDGPFAPGKVVDAVVCEANPSQTYALYIPAQGNAAPLPAVYFFDAHGAGVLPLTKYKALADKYGFILIGSNNSKNGNDWPTAQNIWQALFTDTQKRLKINGNRVYTCGFSGGAKVAGYVALKYPIIKGVIANGAGLPDEVAAGDFNFSFTALAGEGDMNMADLVTFTSELGNTRARHRMIIFDGKHEWAPENTMAMAFAGLQFDAMQQGLLPKNDAFINGYVAESKNRVGAFYQANQLIKAERECRLSISFLDGLANEAAWFKQKAAALAANSQYQKQQQFQQNLLAKEQNIKAGYMQQFQQGGVDYWTKTITSLQTAAAAKTAESPMYQRLLAYLSLAFYSISNQLINNNQNDGARHFVELYKLADATNSEAWYFSAVLHGRERQSKAAENDLLKAAGLGFAEKSRMLQQPDFKNLPTPINFSAVENRMAGH